MLFETTPGEDYAPTRTARRSQAFVNTSLFVIRKPPQKGFVTTKKTTAIRIKVGTSLMMR